jgi:hypothetical protein
VKRRAAKKQREGGRGEDAKRDTERERDRRETKGKTEGERGKDIERRAVRIEKR